nr:zinc finger BED domain-containing protein RICESLEEPER 2-like [Tanacetum cinerariifolium]
MFNNRPQSLVLIFMGFIVCTQPSTFIPWSAQSNHQLLWVASKVFIRPSHVARSHGGDGGGEDRPLHTMYPAVAWVALLTEEITDTKGPVPIQFELRDKQTVMPIGDHAAHWSSYIGEVIRGFWKENETMFSVLSRMAMDLISVQASSVAFEFAFSTSGRVLSIRRTRLTLASLEMCMCLKDHLDAKERKQDKCPLETPLDFEEDVFDDELQRNEATPLSDEEIALDANGSSEGTMSPGGP